MTEGDAHKPVLALDAGGVLVNYDFKKVFVELSQKFGIALDPQDTPDLTSIFHPLEKGDISWDAVRQGLIRHWVSHWNRIIGRRSAVVFSWARSRVCGKPWQN